MKITHFILFFILPLFLGAQQETIVTHADQMPYFPGCQSFSENKSDKRDCSNQKLVQFISQKLVYPALAKEDRIEGIVYVSFIINQKGILTEPSILRDIGGECGAAALAVLQEMPNWEAGIHNGKEVSVKLNLPIQFSLKKEIDELQSNFNISYGQLKGISVSESDFKNNINNGVNVRDEFGNMVAVEEISFIFEKKGRKLIASNRDGISSEMKKLAKKVKAGGQFSIQAILQQKGKFITTKRTFQITSQP